MRIRKCAARLLGTLPACSPPPLHAAGLTSPPPPPQARSWDSEASSSGAGLLCELNRSPWDDLMCLELIAPYVEEKEEEDGGILGNGVKAEVGEARGIPGIRIKYEAAAALSCVPKSSPNHCAMERIGAVDSHARNHASSGSEASMNWSGDKVEDKAKMRRKKKDKGAAVTESGASCKKSDGKGWHCKRRAQHPHSLCNYHLTQLRSYSSSHGHAKLAGSAKGGHGGIGGRKKKSGAAAADSNFYYYYSGFGPWRGKTRGGGGDNGDQPSPQAADEEDEKEISESGNEHYVDEGSDDNDGGHDDDGDDNNGRRDGNGDDSREEGGKRSYKKRGRKRMKARSLKSLL